VEKCPPHCCLNVHMLLSKFVSSHLEKFEIGYLFTSWCWFSEHTQDKHIQRDDEYYEDDNDNDHDMDDS
jgi:hypothetical protein